MRTSTWESAFLNDNGTRSEILATIVGDLHGLTSLDVCFHYLSFGARRLSKMEWVLLAICASMAIALLLVRSPVGGALGLFGFLLPFDTVLVLAQVGRIHIHITWIVGAAAGVILLLIARLGSRLTTPPRAAEIGRAS